ncbi:hypothetical protein [Candidatus Nitrotoga arctica]|uniref:Membrane protein n=1 Tax=Candidatus Nitrotoga arctica TaxID=453162 RepID=A0ABN8ANK5_9PROT|nr:hypothetical protein [Candidatus Nitrotoga arctica]CAG9933289.1 putative membrane protein [Candidatus Nitrotoga arctica]
MRVENKSSQFRVASAVFNLLNPIPFGFFVAVLIFDIIYANSADVLWVKSSAWLVSMGLLFAIVPRLINLYYVWFGKSRATLAVKVDFWLNVFGIATALVNAFVHSRDAYAVIPDGVWLSVATVVALAIGRVILAWQNVSFKEFGHE